MPWSLRIMELLGVALLVAGGPVLVAPAFVRRTLGLPPTAQLAYVLRIVGTVVASLGLVLIVFARVFWSATA